MPINSGATAARREDTQPVGVGNKGERRPNASGTRTEHTACSWSNAALRCRNATANSFSAATRERRPSDRDFDDITAVPCAAETVTPHVLKRVTVAHIKKACIWRTHTVPSARKPRPASAALQHTAQFTAMTNEESGKVVVGKRGMLSDATPGDDATLC